MENKSQTNIAGFSLKMIIDQNNIIDIKTS